MLAKNDDTPKNALKVNVLGEQFAWNFTYPTYGNLQSTTLRLPINRTTKLDMTSRDVIHSFFVPEFRQKEDLLPGQTTTINVTPTKLGHYVIQCAELCGLGHSAMLGQVLVMRQADFQKWATGSSTAAQGGGAAAGKALFTNNGCASCHTYAPAGATGKVGPDLDKLPALRQAGEQAARGVRQGVDPRSFGLHPARVPERDAVVQEPSRAADRPACRLPDQGLLVTSIAAPHEHHEAPPGAPSSPWRWLTRPRLDPRRVDVGALRRHRPRHRRLAPLVGRLRADPADRDVRDGQPADRAAGRLPGRASAPSTTGSTTSSGSRRGPTTTRATAPRRGRTTSGSTPTTRSSASST